MTSIFYLTMTRTGIMPALVEVSVLRPVHPLEMLTKRYFLATPK
jgi:hypothetical protein